MLVAGDVYRPAAIDQLKILGEQVILYFFKRYVRWLVAVIMSNSLLLVHNTLISVMQSLNIQQQQPSL